MDNDIGELFEKPNEKRIEWRISDFSSLKAEVDACYTSPTFLFADLAWKLQLYPNGRTPPKTEGSIHLCLWKIDCISSRTVSITLGIKKADGEEEILAQTNNCKFDKFPCGARLLSRSDMLRRNRELAPSDAVTLICTLKSDAEHFMKVSLFGRLWNVSRSWKDMLDAKKRTDVVFKLKDGEIPAHRMILESRCAVFNRMFDVDMREAETGEVNVVDVDKDVFRVVLKFVYSGEPEGLSTENMLEVYKVAHKYELQDLRQICVELMKKNLATDRVCDIFALAHLYQEKKLKELTLDYFANNKTEICKSEEWKIWKINNPEIVIELIEHALNVRGDF